MRKLTTKEAVDNAVRVLLNSGQETYTNKWQAQEVGDPLIEVTDMFLSMGMERSQDLLGFATGADLPWAEDHFQERLTGPSNPGKTYLYWPYAREYDKFLQNGKFSHTYQERFWPTGKGKGYRPGSWADVKEKLGDDLSSRQVFLSIWHPEDQLNKDVRVPCTIGYWFKVTNGVLNITYLIRSCDARRHFRNDVYMAQRLAQEMLLYLHSRGHSIILGTLSIWIGSFHCFQSDIYALKKQVK